MCIDEGGGGRRAAVEGAAGELSGRRAAKTRFETVGTTWGGTYNADINRVLFHVHSKGGEWFSFFFKEQCKHKPSTERAYSAYTNNEYASL